MDPDSEKLLASILRSTRVAGLGTLREGAPFVSMVAFAPMSDFSLFYIHVSRLAQHTQDMLNDPRVSLMISEADDGRPDPQTLGRISIRGKVESVPPDAPDYTQARSLYLTRFPASESLFGFGDFSIFRIIPQGARYVAGFARAFSLTVDALMKASQV